MKIVTVANMNKCKAVDVDVDVDVEGVECMQCDSVQGSDQTKAKREVVR